jgi:hypothetical protein
MEFYYQGTLRWACGFENPNKGGGARRARRRELILTTEHAEYTERKTREFGRGRSTGRSIFPFRGDK